MTSKEMKVGIRYPRLTVVSIVYKNNRDVATLVNLFSERVHPARGLIVRV